MIYGKKKNIFNYIDNNPNVFMSKSLMFMEENVEPGQVPEFKRLDEWYNIDILDFNYDEFINGFCNTRKTDRIFEMMDECYPESKIQNFKEKKYTDYNIYNYKHENEIFQLKAEEYCLAMFNKYKPQGYKYVCVRNLIINEKGIYNKLLIENNKIDNNLLYSYKKVLNNDTINDLYNTFLKFNNNSEINNYFKELLEICIRI